LVDQVLDDLQLVDRVGIDRTGIDEFDAKVGSRLVAARLHGIEVGNADELRHEGDALLLRHGRPSRQRKHGGPDDQSVQHAGHCFSPVVRRASLAYAFLSSARTSG
jgi:hypothetical protein